MLAIGIDVGGTNTDCAILRFDENKRELVASAKCTTSLNVTDGIVSAMESALKQNETIKV